MTEHLLLRDLVVVYALALTCILLLARLHVPPIVAMMAAGLLAGPSGLGLLRTQEEVWTLAELGITLLLFTVGLEFSVADLRRLWRPVVGGGVLQVGVTAAVVGWLVSLAGFGTWRLAIFIGAFVALSSTAIVIKALSEQNRLDTPSGRLTVGVLLFQDLAIVVLLLLVPVLAGQVSLALVPYTLLKATFAVFLIGVASHLVLPPILRFVSRLGRREGFALAVALASVGAAWISEQLGLSMALGAFLAGLMLSGREFTYQIHAEIRSLRDVLSSLFFVALGTLIDLPWVLSNWAVLIGVTAAVLVVKALCATTALWLFAPTRQAALVAGLALAQVGEFSFVLGDAGRTAGLLSETTWQLLLGASVLTMALTPLLLRAGPRIAGVLRGGPIGADELATTRQSGHVIILGFGTGGRMIAQALTAQGISFVALDLNGASVREAVARGEPVFFADGTHPEALEGAGIHTARALAILLSDPEASLRCVSVARALAPNVPILVRTRYRREAERLRQAGATVAVAEEIETSLEVLAQLLARLGVPGNDVEASLDLLRRETPGGRPLTAPVRSLGGLVEEMSTLPIATHRVSAGDACVGQTLAELQLRPTTGMSALAVYSDGHYLTPPPADRPLGDGDILYLVGPPERMGQVRKLLAGTR